MRDLDLIRLDRRIARLLAPWDLPHSPGATVGVVRDGALILHRSAGQASLELGVPIGPRTAFRVASVTKQFTCAAILLLAQEGRLAPEDDIRDHLPEMPDLGQRITVAHLMHNTSGLRDMLEIMRIGGTDLDVPCTPDELMAAILRQRALNFAPGSRFLYSNTNFLLLGRIVERLAGESLGSFLERRILGPLGMTQSRLVVSTTEVVPDLATGYLPAPRGFVRAAHGFPLGGEGGLVSSVTDLALWDRNFTTGLVGGTALGRSLTEQAPFGNGRMNEYARGLQVKSYRGLRTEDHGGLWPGYKTEFLRVPERDLTVICIANNGAVDAYRLAHDVLDAAIGGTPGVHPVPPLPPRAALERLPGCFLDPESGTTLDLALNEAGEPVATTYGVPFTLAPTEDGRLAARRGAFPFIAAPAPDGQSVEVETDAGHLAAFRRVVPLGIALPDDLPGRYASEEAGAVWTLSAAPEGGASIRVAGPRSQAGPWPVEPVTEDRLRVRMPGVLFQGWLDVLVLRDAGGRLIGLKVSGGRAKNFVFQRMA